VKPGHIIKGWLKGWGIISVTTAEEKLSALRLGICGKCEFAKTSSMLEVVNGDLMWEMRLQCTKCHCPCLQKSLIPDEKCPIKSW